MHHSVEEKRVAALKNFELLDTEPEERFDRITRLAKRTMKAEIALVSLIDEDRQWFKSCQGLDVPQTERGISFCTHAIERDDVFVVLDASKDEAFKNNPLVTGPPHIRFYAGAQLNTDTNETIGTICIISKTPRDSFDEDEKAQLRLLASLVMDQANARLLKRQIKRQSIAHKEAELLLESTNLELHEQRLNAALANRSKTEFLANIGHELKTPLNAIIGFSELMLNGIGGDLSPQHTEYLADIAQSGNQLKQVIEQVLAISRYDPDEKALVNDVALESLVMNICDKAQHQAQTKQLRFDIRGIEHPLHIETDPDIFIQIIRPLIDNAIKFAPHKSVVGVLVEVTSHDAGTVCIRIEDEGPGIPIDELDHIFEPFFQLDGGLNRVLEGAGLGLTVARQCAERLRACLKVSNREEGGTRAEILIPAKWSRTLTAKSSAA